jgi:hypothetical protein
MTTPDPAEIRRIARLCLDADGPDRAIDVLAWAQIGWTAGGDENLAWRGMLHLGPDAIVNATDMAEAIRRFPQDLQGIGRSWNVPALSASKDAASSILGEDELPFVLLSQSDFGGLRRARVFDGETVSTSADAATVPLAVLAAALKALAERVEAGHGLPQRP